MTGRLILIRHAETVTNTEGKIDTAPPGGPLSPLGEQQAIDLGTRLASRDIGRILCSTATRTQQTAAPLARALGVEPEPYAEFCELLCGGLDGRNDPESRAIYKDIYVRWIGGEPDLVMPEGESWTACAERMVGGLRTHLPDPPWDHDIVLITHAGSIRVLMSALFGEEVGGRLGYPFNVGCIELIPLGGGRFDLGPHDAGEVNPFDALDSSGRA